MNDRFAIHGASRAARLSPRRSRTRKAWDAIGAGIGPDRGRPPVSDRPRVRNRQPCCAPLALARGLGRLSARRPIQGAVYCAYISIERSRRLPIGFPGGHAAVVPDRSSVYRAKIAGRRDSGVGEQDRRGCKKFRCAVVMCAVLSSSREARRHPTGATIRVRDLVFNGSAGEAAVVASLHWVMPTGLHSRVADIPLPGLAFSPAPASAAAGLAG